MLTQPGHEASTLTCAHCGGAVALAALAAQVSCPYCRAPLALAPSQLVELERYRAHVGTQLARADAEYGKAAHWDRWYGGAEAQRRNNPLIVGSILFAPMLLLGAAAFIAQQSGVSNPTFELLMQFGGIGMVALMFAGYLGYYFIGRSDSKKTLVPLSAAVSCPSCGAPHALGAGAVLDRCRHCGSALLPDARVMQRARGQVDQALLRAEIERSRAERRGMRALSGMSAANAVPYYVLGSFLPMTLIGAVAGTASVFSGDRDATPELVLLLWGLLAINIGWIAAVYGLRRRRHEHWQRITLQAIAPFGGRALVDIYAVGAWLDWSWAGAMEQTDMFPGPYFFAGEVTLHGYATCLTVNPVGISEDYPGSIAIRVGAWLEAPNSQHPASVALARWLSALGAELAVERAGIVVRFDEAALERVGRGTGRELSDAIGAAAQLAANLGASRSLPTHYFRP
jgi:hypothetical protein